MEVLREAAEAARAIRHWRFKTLATRHNTTYNGTLDCGKTRNPHKLMKAPNKYIPGSRALRALEAVVRLGKATSAAEELNITQAAVSHRIRELEEDLGQPLFRRVGKKLEPTPAALVLADAIRSSFTSLEEALSSIGRPRATGSLTVSMLPALASKWLAPRLPEMLREFRMIDLRVIASRDFVDFRYDQVDAAIRYGRGNWTNVHSRHLCDELMAPVIAPALLARIDPRNADAFTDIPLLHCDNPVTWEDWFRSSAYAMPRRPSALFFDDDAAMLESAAAGTGVALGRSALVAHDLRAGRLVAPFGNVITSTFSYWFVQDADTRETAAHRDFYGWARTSLGHDSSMLGIAQAEHTN